MQCNLVEGIHINIMSVATGWGSSGRWNVKFLSGTRSRAEWVTTINEYNYPKGIIGNVGNSKKARITVHANNDAHMALGENTDHHCTKYEIVIGGWGNGRSVIRNGN